MKIYSIALAPEIYKDPYQFLIKGEDELDALCSFLKSGAEFDYIPTQGWDLDRVEEFFREEGYGYNIIEVGTLATPFEMFCRQDGVMYSNFYDSYDELFTECARHIAYSDCAPDFEILGIKGEGHMFTYTGWKPGMVISFMDLDTKEIVWESAFPAWDH